MDRAEKARNALPPCPDCGTETLEHDPTCPLEQSITAVCQADAYWFRRMPWIGWRTRPITPPERAEWQRISGHELPPDDILRVRVQRLGPGVRRRSLVLIQEAA